VVKNEWRRCASCDIEISGVPELVDGDVFCCPGCAEGGPCTCTYEGDQARYPHNGHGELMLALERLEDGL
jgi:hypothetical protein